MLNIFRALSCETRYRMLKILTNEEMHISELARRTGISTPAAIKHIKILEKAGLIEKRKVGKAHLLKARTEGVYSILNEFCEPKEVEVEKGTSVLDALRKVSGVSVTKVGDNEYVIAIDGEKGYFVYEVNGEVLDVPMNRYRLYEDKRVMLKELIPVTKKHLKIKIR